MSKQIDFTEYQAKYYAHEIFKTKRKLRVIKHFAPEHSWTYKQKLILIHTKSVLRYLHSALPSVVVLCLADEVGLGKTIEAGLVISQKWAEENHKILIIVPATLRKQW